METTTPEPDTTPRTPNRKRALIGTAALAVGLAVGGAGLAGAVTGSNSSTTSNASTAAATAPAPPSANGTRPDPASMPNGPGETLLTGDDASKVTAAALAEVPGATVIRVETDSSGQGVYEAHLSKSDGTQVTVMFDKDFNVTATEDGFGRGGPQGQAGPQGPPAAAAPGSAGTSN